MLHNAVYLNENPDENDFMTAEAKKEAEKLQILYLKLREAPKEAFGTN